MQRPGGCRSWPIPGPCLRVVPEQSALTYTSARQHKANTHWPPAFIDCQVRREPLPAHLAWSTQSQSTPARFGIGFLAHSDPRRPPIRDGPPWATVLLHNGQQGDTKTIPGQQGSPQASVNDLTDVQPSICAQNPSVETTCCTLQQQLNYFHPSRSLKGSRALLAVAGIGVFTARDAAVPGAAVPIVLSTPGCPARDGCKHVKSVV